MNTSHSTPKIEELRRTQRINRRQIQNRTGELEKVNQSLGDEITKLNGIAEELKIQLQERTVQLTRIKERLLKEAAARTQDLEMLRQASKFNQLVMASMGEGLYTLDSQGLLTYINPAAERLFGWSSAELLGCKMHDMTHYRYPDGTPFPADQCVGLQVLQTGAVLSNHEDVFIRKDGTFFPVVYTCSPLTSDGGIDGLVVVFWNVTAKKLAEAWRQTLIKATQDAVISIDHEERIAHINPAAARMFGYSEDEVLGKKLNILMPEPYASEHHRYIVRYGRTGEKRAIGKVREVSGKRKNGEVFPIELSVMEVGEVGIQNRVHYAAFIRDISERKRVEEEIKERIRQQAVVTELGRYALSSTDVPVLLERACSMVTRTLGVEYAKTLELLPDGQAFRLLAGVGWKEGGWEKRLSTLVLNRRLAIRCSPKKR